MKTVLENSCRESQNTHFVVSNVFSKIMPFVGHVEKYCRAGQTTGDNGACALRDGNLRLQIYTQAV